MRAWRVVVVVSVLGTVLAACAPDISNLGGKQRLSIATSGRHLWTIDADVSGAGYGVGLGEDERLSSVVGTSEFRSDDDARLVVSFNVRRIDSTLHGVVRLKRNGREIVGVVDQPVGALQSVDGVVTIELSAATAAVYDWQVVPGMINATITVTAEAEPPEDSVPVTDVVWTHSPAKDEAYPNEFGVSTLRGATSIDADGNYYPVGAVHAEAVSDDSTLRSSGRILGGTLGDVADDARTLLDSLPLSAAIEALTPAERDSLSSTTMESLGLAGSTWSTALGAGTPDQSRDWAELLSPQGIAGARSIPLSKVALKESPLRRVELGAVLFDDARLGDLPLPGTSTRSEAFAAWCRYISCADLSAETTVRELRLRNIPMRRVPLDNIPLRRLDRAKLSELMSIPMRRVDLGLADGLASIPMRRVDLSVSRLGSIPMRRVDLEASGIGAIPMRRVDLARSPLGAVHVGELVSPERVIACPADCAADTLAQVAEAGLLVDTATLADLVASVPEGAATVLSVLGFLDHAIGQADPTVGDVLGWLAAEVGDSLTVGDLLVGLPADDLPGDGAWDEQATLGDLLEGLIGQNGFAGFSTDLVLGDVPAVRLDVTATMRSVRNESARLAVKLPDGGRTEVEFLEPNAVASEGGGSTCPPQGQRLADASAGGEFALDLVAGCSYRLTARVSIPVRSTLPTLGLSVRSATEPTAWTVDGPEVRMGHGPDRDPTFTVCSASWPLEGDERPEHLTDCTLDIRGGMTPGSPPPFVSTAVSGYGWEEDFPAYVLSTGYFDDAADVDSITLPRYTPEMEVYVRRVDGGPVEIGSWQSANLGGVKPLIGAWKNLGAAQVIDEDRPELPDWDLCPSGCWPDSWKDAAQMSVGSGWATVTAAANTWSAVRVRSEKPGWYQIAISIADDYPQSSTMARTEAVSAGMPPSMVMNCADYRASTPPTPSPDAQLELLTNWGMMWARYGGHEMGVLEAELQEFVRAGLGVVTDVGPETCGWTTTPPASAVVSMRFDEGRADRTMVALGDFSLISAVGSAGAPGDMYRQNLDEDIEIGREVTYGPGTASLDLTLGRSPAAEAAAPPSDQLRHFGIGDTGQLDAGSTRPPVGDVVVDRFSRIAAGVNPDQRIGRLVETPSEVASQLRAYRESATRSIDRPYSLVAGYDFLSDSSQSVASYLDDLPLPADRSLISETWTAADLLNKWSDNNPEGVSVVNAHYDHTGLLSAAGNSGQNDVLTTTDFVRHAGNSLAGSMVVSVGCHSGLPYPDILAPGSPQALDWPQAMAQAGVPVYVANVTYGYGDSDLTAYSERLEELFIQQLAFEETVGDAFVMAKRLYIAERIRITAYDAKVLSAFTLYGIPTWKTPGEHPKPGTQALPRTVSGHASSSAGDPTPFDGPYSSVDAVPFTFFPRFQTTAGGATATVDTDRGSYVTGSEGNINTAPGEAVLPLGSMALPIREDTTLKGVLWDSVDAEVVAGAANPVISMPTIVSDGPSGESPAIASPRRSSLARSTSAPRLTLVTGRFDPAPNSRTGTYSVFTRITGQVFYSGGDSGSTTTHVPPAIVVRSSVGGSRPEVTVEADHFSGLVLARLIYRTSDGSWTSVTLRFVGNPTKGSVTLAGAVAADASQLSGFVQVLSGTGDVAVHNL